MQTIDNLTVTVNGVAYRWPSRPVVVVCIDGGDPMYFDQAKVDGIIPNVERFMESGFSAVADGVVPSLTNPNNLSIVTGSPPSVHGISGNFFLDQETGSEVMMNDPDLVRAESLFAEFSDRNAQIVAITAKDKLLHQLGRNVNLAGGSIIFSSEKADQCTLEANGIENVLSLVGLPLPAIYSAELSLFVLEAGVKLLEHYRPQLMYLSLSDYLQHKYAPGAPEINVFYTKLDDVLGRLVNLGAVVGVTADHGMNDKSRPDGSPNVLYLQDELDREFPPGKTRVILPITDPYVVHHGSLGGFARVYCYEGVNADAVAHFSRNLHGVEVAYDKEAVCEAFDLPPDREGDVAVISNANTAIGHSRHAHDLSTIQGFRLRSHGGISECRVPFLLSEPLNEAYAARARAGTLRNYEIFDFAINGLVEQE